jgi:hypothetical protein
MAPAAALTPDATPARLVELSVDAREAVLLDAAGALAGSSSEDPEVTSALGELARELMETVDRSSREPAQDVEVQVPGGAVFASRTPRWTLAVVTRRAALSSLMLWDLHAVLRELEEGVPIRRASAAEEGASDTPASDRAAAAESPVPELGDEP